MKYMHVPTDKYMRNSIKDSKRRLQSEIDIVYVISGPYQIIKQSMGKIITN